MRGNRIVAYVVLVFIVLSVISIVTFDTVAAKWVRDFHKSWSPTYVFYYFTVKPFIQFLGWGGNVLAAGVILLVMGRVVTRSLYTPAIAIIVAYAVSGLIAQLLKHLLGRARPRITEEVVFIGPTMRGGFDAFPSGHTIVVFCIATVLSRLYPRWAIVWFAYALVIACERVVSFTHFPGDVLAGAAVGIFTGFFLLDPLLQTPFMRSIMSRLVPALPRNSGDSDRHTSKEHSDSRDR